MKSNSKKEGWTNIVAITKDGEKYVFVYDDASRKALLGAFGRLAQNPDLNFSWHDAAVLSRKVRENEGKLPANRRVPQLRTR
jgi:hypothetical protein